MLTYRHAFHAGNHAAVLKHFLLLEVLHYCSRKDKPWWFIVSPPWNLPQALEVAMPGLVSALGLDDGAGFDLECHIE